MPATTPRMEKIPAPIIPPTPILIAATRPMFEFPILPVIATPIDPARRTDLDRHLPRFGRECHSAGSTNTGRSPPGVAPSCTALDAECGACVRLPQHHGETHENCPRNALRASRRNARVAVSVVGHE